jgi:hypothetical protein
MKFLHSGVTSLLSVPKLSSKSWSQISGTDQPRGLAVSVSDYSSSGTGFDSRFYRGDFSLKGKIPMVTMV